MTTDQPSRLVRLFSTAVIDQLVLSGAGFLVGYILIRHTSDYDYGLFVLVQSAITLLLSGQGAWLDGPIAVLAPKKSAQQRRLMVGVVETSHRRFVTRLTAVAVLVPPAGYLLHAWNGTVAMVAAMGVLAGWTALRRDYLRTVLLVYSRPQGVLRADVLYAVILVAGVLLAAFRLQPAVVWSVAALLLAGSAGAWSAHRMLGRDPGWEGGDARDFWAEIRPLGLWAAVGAIIYWIFSQSYNYILAGRLSVHAVADVNAARLLIMPTIVLTVGVKSLLTPSAAAWLAESGLRRLMRRLLMFIAGMAALDVVYFVLVWVFRGWLTDDFLHKAIADRDRLLMLWAGVSLISLLRDVLQSALLALERFRPMAWLTGVSAIVALSLTWVGIAWWGAAAALIGQLAGETVNLGGIIFLLWHADRSYSSPTAS